MPPRRKKQKSRLAQFSYALRYRVGEYAVRGFIAALPLIPFRLLLRFTNLLAWVAFGFLRTYRTRMEENLVAALGQEIHAPSERKALVWRAWKNFARGVLDTTAVMHFSREKILATVAVEG
ncbi:MAG TPA: hypothetical protein VJ646_22040, partial [Candidatus Binatia bacterium]|nr:hypothetical protein [Candidatus Binatia bacterium]